MAYAWYPQPRRIELRYVASVGAQMPFAVWRCDANEPVPSLANTCPLLSWYEREITDLFGLNFIDQPQPGRLVLHEGANLRQAPFDPDYPPNLPLSVEPALQVVPELAGADADVQLLPFGPVRADVFKSAEFLFFYVGEAILHYQPRLFFKHRGMEKRFEGLEPSRGVVLAERVSASGAWLMLLPIAKRWKPLRIASFPHARNSCACCSPKWSNSTIICIILDICATRRRSRSVRPRASCLRSKPNSSTPG